MAPGPGHVTVYTIDPPLSVTARLSEDAPTITQGYGGWEEVARPRKSPLTTFQGSPGLHMSIGLMLDGWAPNTSVERECAALEKMGWPTAADGEPPRVRINRQTRHPAAT